MAGGAQAIADRFAIGAGGPASEILNVKARHGSSLGKVCTSVTS
jgi:hypothetical protein